MNHDEEELISRALADYLDRQAGGETVGLDDFCKRHSEIAPELRRQIEALDDIGQAVQMRESPSQEIPERLSGHRILGEIGAGGMGRVFLALDESLGRRVAIKTLNARYLNNAVLRERFMREARAMAQLSHPNIVRIYNLGTPEEQPHFVMEYVEGVALTQAARPLTFEQKADLVRKVALAVQFLHDNRLLHRDLKPGNILVGVDLEPKLLDFGLALEVGERDARLSRAGEVVGTPEYFSPEQAAGQQLDARSDVFSLGTILYELLTGSAPFTGGGLEAIRRSEPTLPRRIREIPGDLQSVCLKALEKDPRDRYQSAREMAADLERFLAGEAVLAAPAAYSRLMASKVRQHVAELEAWRKDHLLSEYEFDAFKKAYDRLVEREDAWIMEVRRLSLPQVSLYLGAWTVVVAAGLLVLFRYTHLTGTPSVLVTAAAAAPALWIGLRYWTRARLRVAVAFLLTFCLLLPVALQVTMAEYRIAAWYTQGREDLELFGTSQAFKGATNAQMWWSLLLSLPVYVQLRTFTRSHVFSLVLAGTTALFCLVTLLRMGLREWTDKDPGQVYFHLIPCAILFFAAGFALERRRFPDDARYFYPLGVAFTLAAMTGVAAQHQPYADWLKAAAPWTRGQKEYLFIINAGLYFVLYAMCERFSSPLVRSVAKYFRFVIPGHVLTSLFSLALAASNDRRTEEAHVLEVLLPITACAFVLLSIPKQMKNYLATGLAFLATGLVRLQQDWLQDRATWPVALLAAGFALMLAAANYAPVKMGLRRLFRR